MSENNSSQLHRSPSATTKRVCPVCDEQMSEANLRGRWVTKAIMEIKLKHIHNTQCWRHACVIGILVFGFHIDNIKY